MKNSADIHPLRKHIEQIILLSDEEFATILAAFTIKTLKKGQFILLEENLCTRDCFILSGSLMQYWNDEAGKEHVIQFAFSNWWIADWASILDQKPSFYNIKALEESAVMLIEYSRLQQLFTTVPKIEAYFRTMFQQAFAAQQRRIGWLLLPAKERYHQFILTYPGFEQRMSQTHIASFLGITRESLSRLKAIAAQRKK
jgi:CRP-like cAMP-binding protein